MARLSPSERRQQGDAAEQKFMGWLDRCVLPYMYVEQSPLTVPRGLKGEIKRPDFLVGVPTIGTIAIDVKAKRIYDNAIIIDDYEYRTFMNFERFFNISVWYVCFPPSEPSTCHLFLNRDLAGLQSSQCGGVRSIAVSLTRTVTADPRRDFMASVLGAIRHR